MSSNHSHLEINIKVIFFSILLGLFLSISTLDSFKAMCNIDLSFITSVSNYIVNIFLRLLKFVSLPILFLSLTSTITKLDNSTSFRKIFDKTIKYTLFTTIIAAIVAMILYILINPVRDFEGGVFEQNRTIIEQYNLSKYIIAFFPDNIVAIFLENNVIAIVVSALLLGLSSLAMEQDKRKYLHNFFDSIFAMFISFAKYVIAGIPYILWAFVISLISEISNGFEFYKIIYYIILVLFANIVQAVVVLPLFLKYHNISPKETFQGMYPALVNAFFSKSSSATLPSTMHCAEHNLKISKKISSITIPLCTTINMNACSAFIYITVLFVLQSNGYAISGYDYVIWIVLATIAAIGNAGVPMGCFFMASAFLSNYDLAVNLMPIILPFYTILDMLETAINVWSDGCVTRVVDKKLQS